MRGDVTKLTADAVLVPSTSPSSTKWFPDGPPGGMRPFDRAFTIEDRVHVMPGTAPGQPEIWLGWFYYQGGGEPPVEWFVSGAEQYLERAFARFTNQDRRPICDRQLPLFALPVVGTGSSGAKPMAGALLSALLLMLTRFAAAHPVDVCLVTKSAQMFSAAQSVRLRLAPLSSLTADSHGRALGPRLDDAAARLARLATSGQLVLFLGSGTSQTNSMPGWGELLGELALLAGFSPVEVAQLRQLELKDQAFVLQHRLGTQSLDQERDEARAAATAAAEAAEAAAKAAARAASDAAVEVREAAAKLVAAEAAEAKAAKAKRHVEEAFAAARTPETVQEAGRAALQALAVERLSTRSYSVMHALLSTIPHSATLTTNSDTCYDAACAAAGESVVILPYESRLPGSDEPGRWLLKLHGDVDHPADIILTYSSSNPYGYEREALSGIVQALLITKHMVFIGFSLQDDTFNQIAATVRRALLPPGARTEPQQAAGQAAGSRSSSSATASATSTIPRRSRTTFGSTLTLSDRPFMAELWPELEAVPMGDGLTQGEGDMARRQRRLEVLLDRISLLTTDTSTHLLDPTFAGAFTPADLELKTEIGALVDALCAEPGLSASGEAYEEVCQMLARLGLPAEFMPGAVAAPGSTSAAVDDDTEGDVEEEEEEEE